MGGKQSRDKSSRSGRATSTPRSPSSSTRKPTNSKAITSHPLLGHPQLAGVIFDFLDPDDVLPWRLVNSVARRSIDCYAVENIQEAVASRMLPEPRNVLGATIAALRPKPFADIWMGVLLLQSESTKREIIDALTRIVDPEADSKLYRLPRLLLPRGWSSCVAFGEGYQYDANAPKEFDDLTQDEELREVRPSSVVPPLLSPLRASAPSGGRRYSPPPEASIASEEREGGSPPFLPASGFTKAPRRLIICSERTSAQVRDPEVKCVIGKALLGNDFFSHNHFLRVVDMTSGCLQVQQVGDNVLSGCTNLETVRLGGLKNVVRIGNSFLRSASRVKEVSFAGMTKVERIGEKCLAFCHALRSVDMSGFSRLAQVDGGFLEGCSSLPEGLRMLETIGVWTETITFNDVKGKGRVRCIRWTREIPSPRSVGSATPVGSAAASTHNYPVFGRTPGKSDDERGTVLEWMRFQRESFESTGGPNEVAAASFSSADPSSGDEVQFPGFPRPPRR